VRKIENVPDPSQVESPNEDEGNVRLLLLKTTVLPVLLRTSFGDMEEKNRRQLTLAGDKGAPNGWDGG